MSDFGFNDNRLHRRSRRRRPPGFKRHLLATLLDTHDSRIVRRNAAEIREVEDIAERRRQNDLQSDLLRNLAVLK